MKLFKKPKSKFYWYDFTVRGRRYRGSTQETKSIRALNVASLKLASVIENTDPLPSKPTALSDFAERFLAWVDNARLEEMTRKFYRNGWRLLKADGTPRRKDCDALSAPRTGNRARRARLSGTGI